MRLDHVGSTSVPGLAAKPIVDLQVSVEALEPQNAYVEPLEGLGYLFVPFPESPEYRFFGRPPERPRTTTSTSARRTASKSCGTSPSRDYLRADRAEAEAHEAVKRESARRNPEDRAAYMAGKDAYIRELQRRALDWVSGHRSVDQS